MQIKNCRMQHFIHNWGGSQILLKKGIVSAWLHLVANSDPSRCQSYILLECGVNGKGERERDPSSWFCASPGIVLCLLVLTLH